MIPTDPIILTISQGDRHIFEWMKISNPFVDIQTRSS